MCVCVCVSVCVCVCVYCEFDVCAYVLACMHSCFVRAEWCYVVTIVR